MILGIVVFILPDILRAVEWKYMYENVDDVPHSDIGIILGASIVRGKPSPILEARADAAIALYHKAKITKILISGDGESTYYNEIDPVLSYIENAGIPEGDILLDYHGLDTYTSMLRAANEYHIMRAIIVTQDFHLPRALYLAHAAGMTAYGLPADNSESSIYNYIREIPACIKAVGQIWMLDAYKTYHYYRLTFASS
ncbi:MAG: secreted protein containing [Candidatus Kaiserbacteria bacterium]|nr:secreted protein containing [Candidatus Kaiserbacteria bacterium]